MCPDESNAGGQVHDVHSVDDDKLLEYFVSDHMEKAINSPPREYRVMVILTDLRGVAISGYSNAFGLSLRGGSIAPFPRAQPP